MITFICIVLYVLMIIGDWFISSTIYKEFLSGLSLSWAIDSSDTIPKILDISSFVSFTDNRIGALVLSTVIFIVIYGIFYLILDSVVPSFFTYKNVDFDLEISYVFKNEFLLFIVVSLVSAMATYCIYRDYSSDFISNIDKHIAEKAVHSYADEILEDGSILIKMSSFKNSPAVIDDKICYIVNYPLYIVAPTEYCYKVSGLRTYKTDKYICYKPIEGSERDKIFDKVRTDAEIKVSGAMATENDKDVIVDVDVKVNVSDVTD